MRRENPDRQRNRNATAMAAKPSNSGWHAHARYDTTDNVLVKWHQGNAPVTQTFDAANRILTMIQGSSVTTYTYDPAGSMTVENLNGGLTTSVYHEENRLLTQSGPTVASTYTYQGDGLRRSAHTLTFALTTMIWDGTDYLGQI